MLAYELDDTLRLAMADQHRLVQGAIATLANRRLGIEALPVGIRKRQGGVVVNERDIAIKREHVIDDWAKPREPTPEEQAVVEAIHEVAALWTANGETSLAEFTRVRIGDPLKDFLGLDQTAMDHAG